MNVERFFQQTASLERRVSADAYTGTTYDAPVMVAVRWFTEVQVLRGDDRVEVTSSAHISLLEPISEGDRVTDESGRARSVIRVRVNRNTRGDFSHRVAYLA